MQPVSLGFEGIEFYPGFLDKAAQVMLMRALEHGFELAPPYRPRMPRTGQPWSIRQTNFGQLGWVSRPEGYGYDAVNETTGQPWPPIPPMLVSLWEQVSGYVTPPECCLVNFYEEAHARMGLHRDEDEAALEAPVISISLGDTCVFRIGGLARRGSTRSIRLSSGDVLVIGGPSRLRFHGVDRIIPGTSRLLPQGGRINLTLRRVTLPVPDSHQ